MSCCMGVWIAISINWYFSLPLTLSASASCLNVLLCGSMDERNNKYKMILLSWSQAMTSMDHFKTDCPDSIGLISAASSVPIWGQLIMGILWTNTQWWSKVHSDSKCKSSERDRGQAQEGKEAYCVTGGMIIFKKDMSSYASLSFSSFALSRSGSGSLSLSPPTYVASFWFRSRTTRCSTSSEPSAIASSFFKSYMQSDAQLIVCPIPRSWSRDIFQCISSKYDL